MPYDPSMGTTTSTPAQRFFNTDGPVRPAMHYAIPPLSRVRLDEVRQLIDRQKYFVMHAPRQSGKTSALLALAEQLNAGGNYRAVYVNVEPAQTAREDVGRAMQAILGEIAHRARIMAGDDFLAQNRLAIFRDESPDSVLGTALSLWAEACGKPLVLLIDEIDALIGDSLISVLRQLRAGYDLRPDHFPQSVILCGVRDVRDYRIESTAENAVIAGGSAFNIRTESLRLADFTRQEVDALYAQHAEETGQTCTQESLALIYEQTRGQPWLVNAIGYDIFFRRKIASGKSATPDDVRNACERLILRRDTHLDQLVYKLKEPRVKRVIGPLLAGGDAVAIQDDDLNYVRDLGLVTPSPEVAIANPIYREVIPRQLTFTVQETLAQEASWYVRDDGALDMDRLLAGFQTFFRENAEHWSDRFGFREAGPQLLLQAFLQRIVNSGGRVEREYGLGRMRTDLLIVWPAEDGARIVVECKLAHRGRDAAVAVGLKQTAEYMDRCDAAEGHLVIFDAAEKRWDEKVFRGEEQVGRRRVAVWGM